MFEESLITGATGGLGKETARVLAKRGAKVIIPARSMKRGMQVKESLLAENPNANLHVVEMDLSSLRSVESFARSFKSSHKQLNILMYSPYDAYARSKLANILHANELSRRLQEEGCNVTANSLHPGMIPTNINRFAAFGSDVSIGLVEAFYTDSSPGMVNTIYSDKLDIGVIHWQTEYPLANRGAATICYAALHPNVRGVSGKYFAKCNETLPSNLARDSDLGNRLWEFSEELVRSLNKPK
ncbi:hypothetical protein ACLOJK_033267 [Asimina triloba]